MIGWCLMQEVKIWNDIVVSDFSVSITHAENKPAWQDKTCASHN